MLIDITDSDHEQLSVWSLVCSEKFQFRSWADDEFSVAYNLLTGDTHLLDALGFELLHLLKSSPASTTMLCQNLAELFPDTDVVSLGALIHSSLLRLQEAGFIVETFH